MGQREKLLKRLRNNPTNVRFQELDKLLRWHGFACGEPDGSHYVYTRAGAPPITVPRARPVKEVYVRRVIDVLEGLLELPEQPA
jgi:predicted RNA binding protein YcfA (HicA-like mRNA interferase family)